MNGCIWKIGDTVLETGKKTYVMGILNVTPDSFSDGGFWLDPEQAVEHGSEMQRQGADIIDIGGQSTRPGHTPVSAEEEAGRILPVIKALHEKLSVPISVDTYYPSVAEKAVEAGASIINDVSGVVSSEMAQAVKKTGAGWIIMHTGAEFSPTDGEISQQLEALMHSKKMEACRDYPDGIAGEVRAFFDKAYSAAVGFGVLPEQLCFDTGIGFGKSCRQNLDLLRDTNIARLDGRPLLVGASRKRVIGETAQEPDALKRMPGTLAANTAVIAGGADIIRVHDVAEAVQAAKVADAIYRR